MVLVGVEIAAITEAYSAPLKSGQAGLSAAWVASSALQPARPGIIKRNRRML
jgi:hypothetical protein